MRKLQFFISILLLTGKILTGQPENETLILIKTNYGDITVKLYDKTVEHKKNFLKLVNRNFYDSVLFHRVIKDFMIQAGDPNSKDGASETQPGRGSADYTVKPEFFPEYYHKRGALAAARQNDRVNPEKRSSSSQFYIVQGEIYTQGKLDTILMMKNQNLRQQIFNSEIQKAAAQLQRLKEQNNREGYNQLADKMRQNSDSLYEITEKYELTKEQRQVYTTAGGYPSLDGDYTVFGEVVNGMEVADKIAGVETGAANRPLKDVIIFGMEVVK
ncbi:MAG: peptidylprolyl isomerase [Prolixibacteraceae bacterium]